MANFWQNLLKPFTVLAPMEDVTDYVFREIVTQVAKPEVMFTEFTSADGLCSVGYDKVVRSLKFSSRQHPIVAQIWGKKPENFLKVAEMIAVMGFDGIDINMGCPDPGVIRKKSGSALINDPVLAAELIASIKAGAGDLAVSVKTRLGFDVVITDEWIPFLLEQKLDALTIHGRTARAKSKGEADWGAIGEIVKLRNQIAPETVIVGNGDVKSLAEVDEKYQQYKVDGVMIGRGIFSNPWIFDRNQRTHSHQERIELLLKHSRLFVETWGDSKNFEILKKFYKMYVTGFPGAEALRMKLMACHNLAEVEKVVGANPVPDNLN